MTRPPDHLRVRRNCATCSSLTYGCLRGRSRRHPSHHHHAIRIGEASQFSCCLFSCALARCRAKIFKFQHIRRMSECVCVCQRLCLCIAHCVMNSRVENNRSFIFSFFVRIVSNWSINSTNQLDHRRHTILTTHIHTYSYTHAPILG